MAKELVVQDGLANVMTGSGTSVDSLTHRHWSTRSMSEYDVDTAYRATWLMRKVVDLPARDATRAWRDWQASAEQIELLEAEEKRLRVKAIVREGLTLGRLGGGIVVMGVNVGQPNTPLPETLPQGCLRYLRAYSRHDVKLGPIITDPMDDNFGEPGTFILKRKNKQPEVVVHRSRVMVFKGRPAGHVRTNTAGGAHPYWGESIVEAVNDAVLNATTAQDEIAGLIEEAKIDIFGIPELMNMVGSVEGENRVRRRIQIANEGKSNHRAIITDAAETFEQRQISWAGMPDVIRVYLSIVAGASDIPATRLLGKAPDGMNATGEGDQDNYDQMIDDVQETDLAPALDVLDAALIPSALGTRPDDVYYEFAPLNVMDEKTASEVESKEADTVSKLVNTGLIPDQALARATVNRMIESGRWPGLDTALGEIGEKWWEIAAEEAEEEEAARLEAELALKQPPAPKPAPKGNE